MAHIGIRGEAVVRASSRRLESRFSRDGFVSVLKVAQARRDHFKGRLRADQLSWRGSLSMSLLLTASHPALMALLCADVEETVGRGVAS
jgi:hypothetical protein